LRHGAELRNGARKRAGCKRAAAMSSPMSPGAARANRAQHMQGSEWFRPPRRAHPSRVPLQSCADPRPYGERRSGWHLRFAADACPRVAGLSFALAGNVDGAPQGGARFGPMILARSCEARRQRCCALWRSISPRLQDANEGTLCKAHARRRGERFSRVYFAPSGARCLKIESG
jgi:hypothetical protein